MRMGIENFSKRKSLVIQNKAKESLIFHKRNSFYTCTDKLETNCKSRITTEDVKEHLTPHLNTANILPEIIISTYEITPDHKRSSITKLLLKSPTGSANKQIKNHSIKVDYSDKSLSQRKSMNSNSLTPKNEKYLRLSPQTHRNDIKKLKFSSRNNTKLEKAEVPKDNPILLKEKAKLSNDTSFESSTGDSFSFTSFAGVLSKIKEFIETSKEKSEWAQVTFMDDLRKDQISVDQSLYYNQICCQIDNIASMAYSIKQASFSIQKTESENYLSGVSNEKAFLEHYDMSLESESRKRQYTSLFCSCKRTLGDVIELIAKLILVDIEKHSVDHKMSVITNDLEGQNKGEYNEIDIICNLTQTCVAKLEGKNTVKPCNCQAENLPITANTSDLVILNNTPNFHARNKAKEVEQQDFEGSQKECSNYNNQFELIQLKKSIESVNSTNDCFSLKKRGKSSLSKVEKQTKVASYPGLSFKGNQSSGEEDFLMTKEEVIVNIPYNMAFEVNKNKDLFIRNFHCEAEVINDILQTDYNYDTNSCSNKERNWVITSDLTKSSGLSKSKARSKSVLYQGFASSLIRTNNRKTNHNFIFPHLNNEADTEFANYHLEDANVSPKKRAFKRLSKFQYSSNSRFSSTNKIMTEITEKKDSKDSVSNSIYDNENAKFSSKRNICANLVSHTDIFKFLSKSIVTSNKPKVEAEGIPVQGELKSGRPFDKTQSTDILTSDSKAIGSCAIY